MAGFEVIIYGRIWVIAEVLKAALEKPNIRQYLTTSKRLGIYLRQSFPGWVKAYGDVEEPEPPADAEPVEELEENEEPTQFVNAADFDAPDDFDDWRHGV